jgi:hypothetical protein
MPMARPAGLRRTLLAGTLVLALLVPQAGCAEEPASRPKLSWETGDGKSFLIPALEVGGFIVGLNQFNRHLLNSRDYDTDLESS